MVMKKNNKMLSIFFNKFYGISIKLNSTFLLNLSFKLFNKPISVTRSGEDYKVSSQGKEIYIKHLARIYIYLDASIGLSTRLDSLFNEYLLNEIQFNENDIVIDCGAHMGELSYYFIDKKILYYAFEPSSSLQTCLEKNIKSNIKNYQIIDKLLLDIEKKFKLYLRDESGDTSIERYNKSEFEYVESIRLDKYFDENVKIKLLKIDAEGYEFEVIKGSLNILKNVDFISIDLGYEKNNETYSPFNEVDKFLRENNFEVINSYLTRKTFLYKNSN